MKISLLSLFITSEFQSHPIESKLSHFRNRELSDNFEYIANRNQAAGVVVVSEGTAAATITTTMKKTRMAMTRISSVSVSSVEIYSPGRRQSPSLSQ